MSDLHTKITNYFQMTPELATSGQPCDEQIRQISKLGYTTVINLAPHTAQDTMPDEGRIVATNFMSYINIPVLYEDPQPEQLLMFCNLLDALKGQKVWIHCVKNSRVAAFIYLYLRYRLGRSHEEARSPMFDLWEADETWNEFMQEGAALLKQQPVFHGQTNLSVA